MVPYANAENQTGQPFHWQMSVIKSKELNAWAMPGGKMAFYTGLVDTLQLTNDEIATVIGHEMAHALKEHGKKKVNMGQFTDVLAQVSHIALSSAIGSDGSAMVVGLTKDWALDKPYSRSNETEADEVGLMLMAKSGFNPQAAPRVWEKNATGIIRQSWCISCVIFYPPKRCRTPAKFITPHAKSHGALPERSKIIISLRFDK
ncbi:putative peptidase [Pasteurella multocida]|nr:putative peptidase [Pasteurella multocida]